MLDDEVDELICIVEYDIDNIDDEMGHIVILETDVQPLLVVVDDDELLHIDEARLCDDIEPVEYLCLGIQVIDD